MRSLAFKLTLAFLAVSLSGIALVAFLARQTTASEFDHFMLTENQGALVGELESYYQAFGSWQGVEQTLPRGMLGAGQGMGLMGGYTVVDAAGQVVAAGGGHRQNERLSRTDLETGLALTVDNQRVGTLLLGRGALGVMSPAAKDFLLRVNRALWWGGAAAFALSLALGIALASALTRPVREIQAATRAVANGQLDQRVPVRSNDELGELAADFNQMSAGLARARDLRRQMTADIAHDLRTPLSVILGHAEALRDGVLPVTPETLSVMHAEALRLNRLVEDLRTLSLAEAGELPLARRPCAPGAVLEHAAAAFGPRAQGQDVSLQLEISPGLPEINADPDRLAQVFTNLLDNALRHTPSGGQVTLRARPAPNSVQLSVRDTGPGIAPEDLPRIFERFYRADKSRARPTDQNGSGLGLAIARSIVEAHAGRIWAESEPGRGAAFFVELPVG